MSKHYTETIFYPSGHIKLITTFSCINSKRDGPTQHYFDGENKPYLVVYYKNGKLAFI
jgi:antitoxin component YwqK of YwqJK toxin-antitoxin module